MSRMITFETAITQIKEFFSSGDSISVQEAYKIGKRPESTPEKNKIWLRDRLTDLKKHGLVEPEYKMENGQRKLERILLTKKGREELGKKEEEKVVKPEPIPAKSTSNGAAPLTDLLSSIKSLQKDNPDYEISFEIKLKPS